MALTFVIDTVSRLDLYVRGASRGLNTLILIYIKMYKKVSLYPNCHRLKKKADS